MNGDGFGESVLRKEDARLLTGRGRFTADIDLPGQVFAHILRSPHAHAEVGAIDAAAARGLPGVLAVLTGADAEADGLGVLPPLDDLKNRDGSAPASPVRPVLARGRVRYVGECVAVVVAESAARARDAAESIEVTYTPLPAVGDVAAAVAEGAPQIWPEAPGNVSLDWETGDSGAVERAFDEARHVTRIELVDNRVMPMPMEPVAAIGDYDRDAGIHTLYAPSQGVHGIRALLAEHLLGLPESALRVITPDVGGGFGLRGTATVEQALVLWAARRLGRPVKWVAERGEAIVSDLHARDHVTRAELALDADGRFRAVRVATLANLGAYIAPRARFIPTQGYAAAITGCYDIAACHVSVKAIVTNTVMTFAYRGAGRPEGIYVIERLVDKAAAELGVSPIELRQRNFVPAAAMPYTTAMDETYDSGDFAACLEAALAQADAAGFGERRRASQRTGKRRGLGVASYVKINGGTKDEIAELALNENGAATLAIGTQSGGQGHETAYAQMVAAGLGLDIDAVEVIQGDTARVAYGQGTGGSSALSVGGVALAEALETLVETGKRIAGDLLAAPVADIDFADGRFRAPDSDRAVTIAEVARAANEGGNGAGLVARARYRARARTYANGSHVCEVEVDPETGRVEIVAYTTVDDVGRVLNPLLAEGQIHGGVAQGIGQALFENCAYDAETGQLLSGSLLDYGLPRADDLPTFSTAFNELPCTTNALGVKGVGEAGATGALAAVVNAVVDALAGFGVRHIDMPLSPERVWRAAQGRPVPRDGETKNAAA
ncbi:MAG: xanthine dehydrogenase family protein molybdopterin-binding subunit [Alphaproteobacteria bacterium]